MTTIAIGCDPNARELKETIMDHVESLGYRVEDYGSTDTVYANVAVAVASDVAAGRYACGILICGTGIGVSIAANKVPGAYAALCTDAYSAERARKSNNANILAFGSQVVGSELAKRLVSIWLAAEWEPGCRSEAKMQRIYEYERSFVGAARPLPTEGGRCIVADRWENRMNAPT